MRFFLAALILGFTFALAYGSGSAIGAALGLNPLSVLLALFSGIVIGYTGGTIAGKVMFA